MHVGAGQALGRHRRQGGLQEDCSFLQSTEISACTKPEQSGPYLLASTRPTRLDAVAALDDIGLEGDGSWTAMQLQEQAAGVAEDGAGFIAAPERRGARCAVLAYGL